LRAPLAHVFQRCCIVLHLPCAGVKLSERLRGIRQFIISVFQLALQVVRAENLIVKLRAAIKHPVLAVEP